MLIQKPKGTYDLLTEKAFQRNHIETKLREIFSSFNYNEIRTPTFEKTILFKRGIGEETDIVSKEMYSFNEDEFTLKPEMTAPVIRSYLENSLYNESPLCKLFYISNMFRRERPQAGRFREFSQFGVEAIGSNDYMIDVEILQLGVTILKGFGLNDVLLKINNIGTLNERERYIIEFKNFLSKRVNELSADSQKRFEKNPLRILDTKNENDLEILKDAPLLYEYLDDNTKEYFQNILNMLSVLNINHEVDYKLVRGIDYYTSTTFEFISGLLGAQNTLIGGGRYDMLVEMLGGKSTPAIGFAAGIERLMIMLESTRYDFPVQKNPKLYIVTIGKDADKFSLMLISTLREKGIKCEKDFLSRSVKAQMKEANKINAEYVIVLGSNEIVSNSGKLKRMSAGTEIEISNLKNLNEYLK